MGRSRVADVVGLLGAFSLSVAGYPGVMGCHRTPEEPEATNSSAISNAPTPRSQPGTCPPDPEPNLAPLPLQSVAFPEAAGGPVTVQVELAANDHDAERGLMYRTQMPEDHGMLFQLDRRDHSFWMHNTCISLDLLYIDGDRIVGIIDSAPTLDDGHQSVGIESTEVLELNGGYCRRHGIQKGQRIVLPLRPRGR